MLKRKKKSLLDQAGEALEGLLPAVEHTVESAIETAKEALAEGRELAAEKVAAVQGETQPKKKCRGRGVRRLLLVGLLAGIGGVLFKKIREKNAGSAQAAPGPRPVPTPAPAAAPASRPASVPPTAHVDPGADDHAGASPDESMSDDASGPHPDTTPDDPAEVVELDLDGESDQP